jgi:hypothetical protein
MRTTTVVWITLIDQISNRFPPFKTAPIDGTTAWDKIAGTNVLIFLKTRYYNGSVI